MANDWAIRVEQLGKCYQLAHAAGASRYRTFREELTMWPRRMFSREGRMTREAFWALRDVSFEVGRGEVFGVIGRNGAGKSTLLKILSRIVSPTAGGADLFGRVGSLLEVGTGFHPELSGRENIFLSGAILGLRRSEVRRRFDEIVAFSGVETFLDTPCKHYSSGMYMRLAFAVAAHLDSEILLVDEVLAVGDAAFREKCLGKMNAVAQSGRTVLLVSHDLAAIRQFTTRSLWLDAGKVAKIGATADVIPAYLETFTKSGGGPAGEIRFEQAGRDLWFSRAALSGDGAPGLVRMGEAVTLTLELAARRGFATKPVRIAIGVRSEEGIPLALIADIDSGFELREGIGAGCRLTVRFDEIRFYPGRYFLRLWAGGTDGLETFADEQDCLLLHVIDAGRLSQRRLLRSQGFMFLQPIWSRENQSTGNTGPATTSGPASPRH